MTRPLSVEQREKIVRAYEQGLGTVKQIAHIFEVTPKSVYSYLKLYRETGDLSPTPIPGRPPILDDENLSILKRIVLSNSDYTLEEYRAAFYDITGINVTIVTIYNGCKILKLRRKKKFFRD